MGFITFGLGFLLGVGYMTVFPLVPKQGRSFPTVSNSESPNRVIDTLLQSIEHDHNEYIKTYLDELRRAE